MDEKCKLVFPKATDPNSYGISFSESASTIAKLSAKEGVSRVSLDIQCLTALKISLNPIS